MSDYSAAGPSSVDSSLASIAGSSPSDKVPLALSSMSDADHTTSPACMAQLTTGFGDKQHYARRFVETQGSNEASYCCLQVGHLHSASERELYSEKGPIADRHEHPARTSSMGHATDIKRSIYLHRQRQITAMTLRAMGGRSIKRTHSVCICDAHCCASMLLPLLGCLLLRMQNDCMRGMLTAVLARAAPHVSQFVP